MAAVLPAPHRAHGGAGSVLPVPTGRVGGCCLGEGGSFCKHASTLPSKARCFTPWCIRHLESRLKARPRAAQTPAHAPNPPQTKVSNAVVSIFACSLLDADLQPFSGQIAAAVARAVAPTGALAAAARGGYWNSDTRLVCWTGQHGWLAAAGGVWMAAFCLGFPAAVAAALWRCRRRLDDPDVGVRPACLTGCFNRRLTVFYEGSRVGVQPQNPNARTRKGTHNTPLDKSNPVAMHATRFLPPPPCTAGVQLVGGHAHDPQPTPFNARPPPRWSSVTASSMTHTPPSITTGRAWCCCRSCCWWGGGRGLRGPAPRCSFTARRLPCFL